MLIGALVAPVLAELVAWTGQFGIVERGESFYVEMLPATRGILVGLSALAVGFGAAMFRGARQGMAGGNPRSRGLVSLVSAIPFGEYLALLAGAGLALLLLGTAWKGLAPVEPVEDGAE